MKRVLMFFFLLATAMFAEVKTELVAHKLLPDGELVAAENAKPGDIILYDFTIFNDDPSEIKNLNPSLNVPHGTTLLPSRIIPAKNYKVSLDGVEFLPYPIKDKEGKAVADELYRAVSWNIAEMKADEKMTVKLGVQVQGPQ